MDWERILNYPQAAYAGDRTVQKTQVVKQGMLTKLEEKRLKNVEKLTLFALLQQATTRLIPVRDGEHDVQAIIVLRNRLRHSTGLTELETMLHKCFPNPVIILSEAPDGRVGVSVSIKRMSLAEHGAVAMEEFASTGLFQHDAEGWKDFLHAIDFDDVPQDDLLTFIQTIADRIRLAKSIEALGFYPHCPPSRASDLLILIKQLNERQREIRALDAERRNKDTSLAESSKIRVRMRDISRNRDEIANEIRSICNG